MEQDLLQISDGFVNPVIESQSTFRAVLEALAHPGKIVTVDGMPENPPGTCPTAAAILLTLLDSDCSLWIDPAIHAPAVKSWLAFHTGCAIVSQPGDAQFAWISDLSELPSFSAFCCGTDRYPDASATVLVNVPAIADETSAGVQDIGLRLQGPGVLSSRTIYLPGVDFAYIARFVALRAANREIFPCGVDVYLTTSRTIVGLPRTTSVDIARGR